MMGRWPIAAGLLLASCASGITGEATGACADAFATAAEVAGVDADEELAATLTACSTYEEWRNGLQDHPGALGLTEQANIEGPMEVRNVCFDASGPVCEDARSQGVID